MRCLVGLLLLSGLLIPLSEEARGQLTPDVGLTLGLNVTTVETPADASLRQMAAGGLVATWDLAGPFSLESQLLLSQKGAVLEDADDRIRYGAGYLDLPIQIRIDGPSLGGVAPYIAGGGFGGLKIFEQQRAGGEIRFPLDTDRSFFRRTNAGLSGSLGGSFPIWGGRRLRLSVHYEHGLKNVARAADDQPRADAPFPTTAETRTWSIRVRFGL